MTTLKSAAKEISGMIATFMILQQCKLINFNIGVIFMV